MRLIAANWKMNPQTLEEARRLSARVEHGSMGSQHSVEIAICVPSVFLTALKHTVHHVKLGAQNMSAYEKGPYTGEISASQLKHLGIKYVIVGHSERRAMGEDEIAINQKIKLARHHKLHPILCVGYGTTQKTTLSAEKKLLTKQLHSAIDQVPLERGFLTIAYEPAWTISKGLGTAKPVAAERSAEVIRFIKELCPMARVIYGASITSSNAEALAAFPVIEGGLVGGASLDALEFLKIIKAFSK